MTWVFTGVAPDLLAPIAAAVAASMLVLYLLRVRRRRIEVPSLRAWRAVAGHQRRALWKERLRRAVSLLLQLIIAALVLLALRDPRQDGHASERRAWVLLIDTSASMTTRDEAGGRTRLQRAVEQLGDALTGIPEGDPVMLVQVDDRVSPLTSLLPDRDACDAALRRVAPSATSADAATALQFALDAVRDAPRATVLFATDGAFASTAFDAMDVPPHVQLLWAPVGASGDNVAVTALTARPYPTHRTNWEVMLEVTNASEAASVVEVELRVGDAPIEVLPLTLGPGERVRQIRSDLPGSGDAIEARVRVISGDVIDRFAMDDRAWALLPTRGAPRVQVVTDGNLFLEAALLLNESIRAEFVRPGAWTSERAAEADVVVFDGPVPDLPERGAFLFFAPTGPSSPWQVIGEVADPIITTSTGDPVLRWITGLRDVNILRASRFGLNRGDRVIASAVGGHPMIVARDEPGRRMLAFAFDPTASDLPLRVAYPLLLINAIDALTDVDDRSIEGLRTGTMWSIDVGDASSEVVVRAPSGRRHDAPVHAGRVWVRGDEAGIWEVESTSTVRSFAASFGTVDRAQIAPAASLRAGEREFERLAPRETPPRRTEPWMWLSLAALGLLLLEWFTFHRRWTV